MTFCKNDSLFLHNWRSKLKKTTKVCFKTKVETWFSCLRKIKFFNSVPYLTGGLGPFRSQRVKGKGIIPLMYQLGYAWFDWFRNSRCETILPPEDRWQRNKIASGSSCFTSVLWIAFAYFAILKNKRFWTEFKDILCFMPTTAFCSWQALKTTCCCNWAAYARVQSSRSVKLFFFS